MDETTESTEPTSVPEPTPNDDEAASAGDPGPEPATDDTWDQIQAAEEQARRDFLDFA